MSRMTNPANSLCFSRKNGVVPTPKIPCVFSGKMRLVFNVTVNFYVAPANPSRFRIFFQGKRASQQPFQIPFVFSSKTRLGFNVIVNLNVMRSTASTFLVFFHRECASQESCRVPWVHFPCVFTSKMSLGFTSDCEFTCDAANRSGTPNIFPRKTRLAGGIPRRHCHCKSSFVPEPGRRLNVDKGALYAGDVGRFDFLVFTKRWSLL